METIDIYFDFFEKILTEEYFNYLYVMKYDVTSIFNELLVYIDNIRRLPIQPQIDDYSRKRIRIMISKKNTYENMNKSQQFKQNSKKYNNQTEKIIERKEKERKRKMDIFTYNIINFYLFSFKKNIKLDFKSDDYFLLFFTIILEQYDKNKENILKVFSHNAYNYEIIYHYIKNNQPQLINKLRGIYIILFRTSNIGIVRNNIGSIAHTNQIIGNYIRNP